MSLFYQLQGAQSRSLRSRSASSATFAVGAVKSLITIRSWWASGLEMTMVGVIEAVVTYGLGLAFGAMAQPVFHQVR